MSKEDSIRTITLKLSDRQHRQLCNIVNTARLEASPGTVGEKTKLYDDIIVNGAAFHTTPELCSHPVEFEKRIRRWPTLDRDTDVFYAEYMCDVCDSKRIDTENEDGGTLQEGAWLLPL
jgi:hypothetical protein